MLLGLAALDAHAGRRPADADIDKAPPDNPPRSTGSRGPATRPTWSASPSPHPNACPRTARRRLARAVYRRADGIRARHGRHPACRGGKANRYFLRGFNLDQGGDFATRIDAVPVNMPSHGCGHTDLDFLVSELVEKKPALAQGHLRCGTSVTF
ncbi:hypothetical protein [Xanthomonas massiliensis]|uniref:hypothetical protein n=1 Tax=Xanthomonas massiliensis TaxID=1720302 RepID=UPI0011C9E62C|nr:hypothetical protein [Xanthomonas massiliensis]